MDNENQEVENEDNTGKVANTVENKVYTMIQERDIEFYVDRRDAGETNQELYNLFLRMFEICDSQTFFVKKYRLELRKLIGIS